MIHNLKLIVDKDNYTYQELEEPQGITDDEYWDWINDNDIILFDDEDGWDNLIVYFDSVGLEPHIITWEQLEDELDKEIVEELKKNYHYELRDKYWNVVTDEPDEQLLQFKVIIPNVIKL